MMPIDIFLLRVRDFVFWEVIPRPDVTLSLVSPAAPLEMILSRSVS